MRKNTKSTAVPQEEGWYAMVYLDLGRWNSQIWHFHAAKDDGLFRIYQKKSFKKGDLVYGANPKDNAYPANGPQTIGKLFYKLPDLDNA